MLLAIVAIPFFLLAIWILFGLPLMMIADGGGSAAVGIVWLAGAILLLLMLVSH